MFVDPRACACRGEFLWVGQFCESETALAIVTQWGGTGMLLPGMSFDEM